MSVSGGNRTIINNYYGSSSSQQASTSSYWNNGSTWNNGRPNVIRDTRGNDTLRGTAKDDLILHRGGNDTVDGGAGNDTLKLNGNRDDYSIRQNRDGSYSIRDNVSGDVIKASNVENLRFGNGENLALNSNQRGTRGDDTIDYTGGSKAIDGGRGNDTIKLSGNRDNYKIRQNRDGTYTIRDKTTGDVLKARNIEHLKFGNGEDLALNTRQNYGHDRYASNNGMGDSYLYQHQSYGDRF